MPEPHRPPYCFDIETLLNECQPGSLLVIGSGSDAAVDNYVTQKQVLGRECRVRRMQPPIECDSSAGRWDMGIITETLEHLDKREAFRLLARLRDLHTARFCVAVRVGDAWPDLKSRWSRSDLLAIGMSLVNSYDDDDDRKLQLYKYDIATYKATPRWLSPDNWANPELWNKYRW